MQNIPKKPELNVNEIFHTIQGEGLSVGKPSVFIRLSGCNLRCVWCDTAYTWCWSEDMYTRITGAVEDKSLIKIQVYDQSQESHTLALHKIIKTIDQYPANHVVITGGEPLLQKSRLQALVDQLIARQYTIEIETNGTISPSGFNRAVQFNVSPKLKNSYNTRGRRFNPDILKNFVSLRSLFKFVVESEQDVQEIQEIIDQINIPHDNVCLMPQATTPEELREKATWLVGICKENNFRYSHRLHIEIWGDKRGV